VVPEDCSFYHEIHIVYVNKNGTGITNAFCEIVKRRLEECVLIKFCFFVKNLILINKPNIVDIPGLSRTQSGSNCQETSMLHSQTNQWSRVLLRDS